MDISRVPAVGRAGVVRAGGRCAYQIGHGFEQHIIAWPRPRLIQKEHVVIVDTRVIKKVDCFPATPGSDTKRRHNRIEIVGAVSVSKVTLVFIVLGRAGETKSVMTATGILYDLNHRLHITVKIL